MHGLPKNVAITWGSIRENGKVLRFTKKESELLEEPDLEMCILKILQLRSLMEMNTS